MPIKCSRHRGTLAPSFLSCQHQANMLAFAQVWNVNMASMDAMAVMRTSPGTCKTYVCPLSVLTTAFIMSTYSWRRWWEEQNAKLCVLFKAQAHNKMTKR